MTKYSSENISWRNGWRKYRNGLWLKLCVLWNTMCVYHKRGWYWNDSDPHCPLLCVTQCLFCVYRPSPFSVDSLQSINYGYVILDVSLSPLLCCVISLLFDCRLVLSAFHKLCHSIHSKLLFLCSWWSEWLASLAWPMSGVSMATALYWLTYQCWKWLQCGQWPCRRNDMTINVIFSVMAISFSPLGVALVYSAIVSCVSWLANTSMAISILCPIWPEAHLMQWLTES